ncbi:MAG: hypothetical protein KGY48_11440 [Wenzhouxiangellaceae bacterium]|jgi:hypothetical protein|nr:hypothetical protein [Wenzhouxiangellaceae bacterium]MBS3747800.1 hypothetical protein [Wenzhouxiangellaceae bacterium]MBS3824762.1 hypothetical protein [Wenzhouxiangellaceae bacterium]
MNESSESPRPRVARWEDADRASVLALLAEYGLQLVDVPAGAPIPGSYWGDDEAGLIENRLYARPDTPLHSILHESCHYICMDPTRRAALHTDAGGDYDEENAVCCLQIMLAGRVDGYSAGACMRDMDRWGYSFRLGSAQAWFERDAEDARAGLRARGIDPATGKRTDGAFPAPTA